MDGDLPHILVIDDDNRLRELLRQFLNKNGFWVSVACDAADARKRLRYMIFDLLVLDLASMSTKVGVVVVDLAVVFGSQW